MSFLEQLELAARSRWRGETCLCCNFKQKEPQFFLWVCSYSKTRVDNILPASSPEEGAFHGSSAAAAIWQAGPGQLAPQQRAVSSPFLRRSVVLVWAAAGWAPSLHSTQPWHFTAQTVSTAVVVFHLVCLPEVETLQMIFPGKPLITCQVPV